MEYGRPRLGGTPCATASPALLLRALTRAAGINPSEPTWRFADTLAADCSMMAAPVFDEVFALSRRIDPALVSVGDRSSNSTTAQLGLVPLSIEKERLSTTLSTTASQPSIGSNYGRHRSLFLRPAAGIRSMASSTTIKLLGL